MPDPGPARGTGGLRDLAAGVRALVRAEHTRRALVLAGGPDWTLSAATEALAGLPECKVLWLSDRPLPGQPLPLAAGVRLLGSETDVLIFDAVSGLDPDSLAAALGTIRGGGLLILLTPPLEDWPDLPDPQALRVAVHPVAPGQISGRYVRRLAALLPRTPGVLLIAEGGPLPAAPSLPLVCAGPIAPAVAPGGSVPRTADQARAVELVLATARGRARRPLVISSDRGRGKSSALGIAAGRLVTEGARRILVTAPRAAAVEPLFARAAEVLGLSDGRRSARAPLWLEHADRRIAFLPPDALAGEARGADLLLVDEAAGIPGPLLSRLLARYPRVVFATTLHGYEGTGRGFELRFRHTLDREAPAWRGFTLSTPIRWAPDDPLEAAGARLLILDAAPAADASVAAAHPVAARVERLDRDALAADEATLRPLFGLLVLAHYQTRPLDLRHLLDGPNLRVYAMRIGGAVAATALVAREGRLDPELCRAVFEGRRRPRGHLLPQTLSCHGGLPEAPRLAWDRVVRIAVHPAVRRRGLARRLLAGIAADARREGVDLLGASFGAEAGLLDFWAACGLQPAHVGTRRNAASGAQGVIVLKGLGPEGQALAARARWRLAERLPTLLAGPLRDLPTELAGQLLASAPAAALEPLAPGLAAELAGFAHANRPFEASLPPLTGLVRAGLGPALRAGRLSVPQRDALIGVVLQHRDWTQMARLTGTTGRDGVIALLRQAAALLGATVAGGGPAGPG